MTTNAVDLTTVLLGQWQASPRIRTIIEDVIMRNRGDALDAVAEILRMLDIDHAVGVWLDYLGKWLGLERPSTTDPTMDRRFGFNDAGAPFDQAPFRGDAENDAVYPLPDEIFRRMVKARAYLVLGDGTVQTFTRAVMELDPFAVVQDTREMNVRIVTDRQDQIEMADMIGALPRTAGVGITYVARNRFGFDDAGVGFGQGPFSRE